MESVTLRDVATHAGVSVRTVSNVVNDYEYVSDQMRKRVLKAIEEMHYRPNLVARNLRNGRTGILALVVPEIDVPYFSELARAIIDDADRYSYQIMIYQTDGDPDTERALFTGGFRGTLFDGVIFSPLQLAAHDLQELAPRMPVVLLGEHAETGLVDHVAIDNIQASKDATSHLISLGRRRIAAIGQQPHDTARLRTIGYEAALRESDLPVDPTLAINVPRFHRADGAEAMKDLLELADPPDAVFCYSDLLALGAMKVALLRGLRVPEDIAIVGIDDIEDGRFATPSLTTISPDKDFISQNAVRRLVERIADTEIPALEFVAPHTLQVRQSTAGTQTEN